MNDSNFMHMSYDATWPETLIHETITFIKPDMWWPNIIIQLSGLCSADNISAYIVSVLIAHSYQPVETGQSSRSGRCCHWRTSLISKWQWCLLCIIKHKGGHNENILLTLNCL